MRKRCRRQTQQSTMPGGGEWCRQWQSRQQSMRHWWGGIRRGVYYGGGRRLVDVEVALGEVAKEEKEVEKVELDDGRVESRMQRRRR